MGQKTQNLKYQKIKLFQVVQTQAKLLTDCIKSNKLITLLLLVAFFTYMFVIFPSGTTTCINGRCGMHFWGANEHDGIWHVALAKVSFNQFPFIFPTFDGVNLAGYNFLLDIVIWSFGFVGLSAWSMYFKILPVLWFVFFSYILYHFSHLLHRSKVFTTILYFFMFFSSSFGFIIQYLRNGNIFGSSGTPTMQGALGMTNPQFMWSAALLMALQLLLHKKKNALIVALIVFFIAGLKIYALVPLTILFFVYLLMFVKNQEWSDFAKYLLAVVLPLLLAYVIFYSGNKSGGIFFDFLAVPKQLVEDPNMWPIPNLIAEWYILKNSGIVGAKYAFVAVKIILYFVFLNFGIRLIGLYSPIHYLLKKNYEKLFLLLTWLVIVITSILMPAFFVQSGDWWNTIQFMYFGFIFANILAAEAVYLIWEKNKYISIAVIIFCVAIFAPAQIDVYRTFALGRSSIIVSDELAVLKELEKLPSGIVLTQPFESGSGETLPDYYDVAYVAAISGKQTYYSDKKQLELLNVNYKSREEEILDNSRCIDLKNIRYIYLRKNIKSFGRFDKCAKESGFFSIKTENYTVKLWVRL